MRHLGALTFLYFLMAVLQSAEGSRARQQWYPSYYSSFEEYLRVRDRSDYVERVLTKMTMVVTRARHESVRITKVLEKEFGGIEDVHAGIVDVFECFNPAITSGCCKLQLNITSANKRWNSMASPHWFTNYLCIDYMGRDCLQWPAILTPKDIVVYDDDEEEDGEREINVPLLHRECLYPDSWWNEDDYTD